MSTHKLVKQKHAKALLDGLCQPMSSCYQKLMPLQTWTVYWIAHSLALMEKDSDIRLHTKDIINFVRECFDPVGGGFGGGPGQISHLATSYAAVNALLTLSDREAIESIDRKKLFEFIKRMKQNDGSFTMHDGGEIDTRASYCAIVMVKLLHLMPTGKQGTTDQQDPENLFHNCADYILACQTYEGGFGSVPGAESHGGYTFCSVASLCMLGQLQRLDLESLMRWLTNRQMSSEGGFSGRSNKLVDSCYSYWQGALFPILHHLLEYRNPYYDYYHRQNQDLADDEEEEETGAKKEKEERIEEKNYLKSNDEIMFEPIDLNDSTTNLSDITMSSDCDDDIRFRDLTKDWLFDRIAMQDYVLTCQAKDGLMKDRPDSNADFYHTCYSLSGLSIAQHAFDEKKVVAGRYEENALVRTHPIFNLTLEATNFCSQYFRTLSSSDL